MSDTEKLRGLLEWALDELDWLGNKAGGFAYPQFPTICGREGAAQKYVEARALVRQLTQHQKVEP